MDYSCAVDIFFDFLRLSQSDPTLRRSEGRRFTVVQFDWEPLDTFLPLRAMAPDEGNISTTAPTNCRERLLTTPTAFFSQYVRYTQNEINIRAFNLQVLIKLDVAPEIVNSAAGLKIAFNFCTVLVLRRHAPD